MTINPTLARLDQWISTHERLANESKKPFVCERYCKYAPDTLRTVERDWNIRFPGPYRHFLKDVGACHFLVDDIAAVGGLQFRRIEDLCAGVAANESVPQQRVFAHFIPIGVNIDRNEALVVATGGQNGDDFAVLKKVPEKWTDLRVRAAQLTSFDSWLADIVAHLPSDDPD